MNFFRPKPIFGRFHFLFVVLIVALGMGDVSSVESVTQISAGDRILFLGNQWVRNGTVAQTGFEVIRLSSYVEVDLMKKITETHNLKLMVGLGHDVVPDERTWPGDTMDGKLAIFRRKLANWLGKEGLDISAFHFNMEYDEVFYKSRHKEQAVRIRALTDTMTLVVKGYQRTIKEVCDSLGIRSYPKLWVFSAKGTGNTTYQEFGCDWDALTSGDYAIDVPTIGISSTTVTKDTIATADGDSIWFPNLENIKEHSTGGAEIKVVRDSSNGKPVVIQFHPHTGIPYRDLYHLFWNDFRELVRHFKAVSDEDSSHFGGNYPIGYYPAFYNATIYSQRKCFGFALHSRHFRSCPCGPHSLA